MGLHVTSVAEIADNLGEKGGLNYFVYFLNYYQFSDELVDTFIDEMPALESHFSELGNVVLVSSIKNCDFYSDVLNWHNVTGFDPEDICPCLLISTTPPNVIQAHVPGDGSLTMTDNQPWAILEIKKLCNNAKDLRELLKKVVAAIARNEDIEFFAKVDTFLYEDRPIITVKPEIYGVRVDLRALLARGRAVISKRRRPLRANYDWIEKEEEQ